MPYSSRGYNYPYYGRTQRALERLGGTLTEMSRGATAEKRRKSEHELALEQLGVKRAGVEAGQEIGLLKTRAMQERERGAAKYREDVLQLKRDELTREREREKYLGEEKSGEEMLGKEMLSRETPESREAIIGEFEKIPSLKSLLAETAPRKNWSSLRDKLFRGLEQLEKDREAGVKGTRDEMKAYEGDLSKYNTVKSARLRLSGERSITEEDINELNKIDPQISALMILFGKGKKLDEKQAEELDLAFQKTENYYRGKIADYEEKYGEPSPEFSFKERLDIKQKPMEEVGVPEFREPEERATWRAYQP